MIPPDAGAGAGGAGAAGAAPSGSGAAGDGQAGSGGTTAVRLTADSLVDLGDGQPVKWSELTAGDKARFMPRDAYDKGVKFLETEAERLTKYWASMGQRQPSQQRGQPQGQQQPQRDPFGTFRGKSVVDGDSIAQMGEQLYREGFGPLAQAFAQIAQQVKHLETQVGETQKSLQPHQESRARQNFESMVQGALGKIESVKGLPEGVKLDAADPFIRDLSEDIYSSYEVDSWKPGEFEKVLKTRLEGMIAFVRQMDQSALKHAETVKRQSFFPNVTRGGGNGQGGAKYKHETGSAMAARARDMGLFRGANT